MNTLQLSAFKPATIALKRTIAHIVRATARVLQKVLKRRSRPDDGSPGFEYAGRTVPVKPSPPHHLVAAKAFPPSDRIHLYPRD